MLDQFFAVLDDWYPVKDNAFGKRGK